MMDEHGVGGLMVVDAERRLIGIVTRRDVYAEDGQHLVADVMTERAKMVVGAPDITTEQARTLMHQARVEKLPLLDENQRCVGLIVIKDIRKLQDYPRSSLDGRGRLVVGASIGVVGDYLDRADALVAVGADTLVIDVAHGHAAHVLHGITAVKQRHPGVPLVAGNVATGVGVRDLAKAGADAIRVGIGPGSACTTRMVAGAGVPQFSSLMECAEAGRKAKVPIIADGGIRYPADLSKAIGAGAHTAMLGSLLAGTPESPGRVIERNGQKFKVYRGMASMAAFMSKQMAEGGADEAATEYVPEGVESSVALRDSAERVIHELVGGLRSGMSYTGVATIDDFHQRVKFVRVTPAGQGESRAHVLER
jgi:IMP dehydrogenase